MAAELAQLRDGASRREFALGCARAVLVATAWPASNTPGTIVRATFVLGIAGCIATTAFVLSTWPHAASDISSGISWWFAAVLAAYVWLAIRPPRALVAHREAARLGISAGFVLFLVGGVGRSVIDATVSHLDGDVAVGLFLTFVVLGILTTVAFTAARAERSFGAGLAASMWAALVCSIVAFNADLVALLTGFNLDAHIRILRPDLADAPGVFMSKHVGSHLASAMQSMHRLPMFALILGTLGAVIGRVSRATSSRAVAPS